MTLIVETGSGVRGANAYVNATYVTGYLTARNRQTENGWSTANSTVQNSAIIGATDYIEKRFGERFKGVRKYVLEETFATASLVFSGLPDDQETLFLGDTLYRFVVTLTGAQREILIGASAEATAFNLASAINNTAGSGVIYGQGLPKSRHASALPLGGTVTLTALANGASGSLIALTGPLTNCTITQFSGGEDGGPQPLSFPRDNAYDAFGNLISGIPDKLKQAVAEYAVRGLTAILLPDPISDAYGSKIKKISTAVGPISETFEYDSGSGGSILFKSYPAADKLLTPFISSGGWRVERA